MSITKKIQLFIILILIISLTSACSISFKKDDQSQIDGGVFKSEDNGGVWKQIVLSPTVSGKPASFASANALTLAMDPQDNQAIYLGTEMNGLFYSYDGGTNWFVSKTLGKRGVQAIAVSPKYKCTIYAVSANRIYRTLDCSRSWKEMYYDNDPKVKINSLVIDPNDQAVMYAGTSRGELIGSSDYGQTWTTIKRFAYSSSRKKGNPPVNKVIINKKDPNIILVGTVDSGIYKTIDRGKSWVNFSEEFLELDQKNSLAINDIDVAVSDGKTIAVATKAGLIRSYDLGAHWHLVDLIPPSDKTNINVVKFNPKNIDEIYYITNTTFGFTKDGGKNWGSKKLPSTRFGSALLVDYEKPNTVYLGVRLVETK